MVVFINGIAYFSENTPILIYTGEKTDITAVGIDTLASFPDDCSDQEKRFLVDEFAKLIEKF